MIINKVINIKDGMKCNLTPSNPFYVGENMALKISEMGTVTLQWNLLAAPHGFT